MNMAIRPPCSEEIPYFSRQCPALYDKTGYVGCLEGWFDQADTIFYSWEEGTYKQNLLHTEKFAKSLENTLAELRKGPLKSWTALRKYCNAHPDYAYDNLQQKYRFRLDTDGYTYMFRCSFQSWGNSLYMYAYSTPLLERYMSEARSGLPILDLQGKERFRMPNGGKVRNRQGMPYEWELRYYDKEHVVLLDDNGVGLVYSIKELPEWEDKHMLRFMPLDPPMDSVRSDDKTDRKPKTKGLER